VSSDVTLWSTKKRSERKAPNPRPTKGSHAGACSVEPPVASEAPIRGTSSDVFMPRVSWIVAGSESMSALTVGKSLRARASSRMAMGTANSARRSRRVVVRKADVFMPESCRLMTSVSTAMISMRKQESYPHMPTSEKFVAMFSMAIEMKMTLTKKPKMSPVKMPHKRTRAHESVTATMSMMTPTQMPTHA